MKKQKKIKPTRCITNEGNNLCLAGFGAENTYHNWNLINKGQCPYCKIKLK